jgi:hypothetical protein
MLPQPSTLKALDQLVGGYGENFMIIIGAHFAALNVLRQMVLEKVQNIVLIVGLI